MLRKVECEYCGKLFYKKESDIKRTKNNYCASGCYNKSKIKDKARTCLYCNKIFNYKDFRDKFCSQSCSAKYNNSNRKDYRERKANKCKNCGKEFIGLKDKIFCSNDCNINYRKKLKIERFLKGELTDKQTRRKSIREYLIERQGGVCEICGCAPLHNGKPLVFIVDHIDGIFENNNPENIRAICPNCNSQTDTFGGKNKNINKTKRHKKQYRS